MSNTTIADVLEGRARWCVVTGDCLSVLPTIPAGTIDAVVTDPPYGVGFAGKKAKIRGGGHKHIPGGYASHDDTPESVARVAVPVIEWAIKNCRRVALTPGIRCSFLYPTPDDIGCFYSAAGTGVGRWGFTCCQPILFYGSDPFLQHGKGSRANSCGQTYPNDANETGHPCAKPIKQMDWLVSRATWQSDVVLDPFVGSGTTGVSCVRAGRRFIGIEIDEGYAAIARRRIAEAADTLWTPPEAKPVQLDVFTGAANDPATA